MSKNHRINLFQENNTDLLSFTGISYIFVKKL